MNLQIVYGSLLGDAYFAHTTKGYLSGGLKYTHSLKQEEYALQKATNINVPFSYRRRNRYDKRTKKTYSSIIIHHHNTPKIFNGINNEFYFDNVKIVTPNILDKLTPLSIAVQYCDDGNLYISNDTKILTLATNGFDQQSRKYIIDYFHSVWGIEFKEQKTGTIRLTSLEKIKSFMHLFGKYIPECMKYKLTNYKSSFYKEQPEDNVLLAMRKYNSIAKMSIELGACEQSVRNRIKKISESH